MVIGLVFARSLHYQFFAYLGWASPMLLWKSGLHPILIYFVCGTQEWAWQVYPSTTISSLAVVGCLLVQICGIWIGTGNEFAPRPGVQSRASAHIDKDIGSRTKLN